MFHSFHRASLSETFTTPTYKKTLHYETGPTFEKKNSHSKFEIEHKLANWTLNRLKINACGRTRKPSNFNNVRTARETVYNENLFDADYPKLK